jgi:hypothetical protein
MAEGSRRAPPIDSKKGKNLIPTTTGTKSCPEQESLKQDLEPQMRMQS